MSKPVKKIVIAKGTKGAVEARKHAALTIAAIRLDAKVLRKKWTRRGQLRKAEIMLCRNAREADAAGFPADREHLARAARAVAEAAA